MLTASSISLLTLSVVTLQAAAGSAPGGIAPEKSKYAIQWTQLSKPCQQALSTIVDSKSEISICSGAGKLFNDVVSNSAVDEDKSLVGFVQTWLKDDLCASSECSSSAVTAAYQQVSSDCAAEVDKQNIIPMAAQAVLLNYENTRKAACLIDPAAKGNGTEYCPTEVLNNIESPGTPISYASLRENLGDPKGWLSALPTWTYCTPCGSGMLNGAVMGALKVLNPDWATSVQVLMEGQCGAGFADGAIPDGLTDGAAAPASNSTGGTGAGSDAGEGGSGTGDDNSGAFKVQSAVGSTLAMLGGVAALYLLRL